MNVETGRYKRVVITRFGGPEVLDVVEDELRAPDPENVRVKVEATSACFTDTMIRMGNYPGVKTKPPFSPGYELVGIVDEVGADVSSLTAGQKIAALTVTGAYSEYVYLDPGECVPVPESIDSVLAISLVLSYVTAYQMLHRVAKSKRGDRILIHGASGAVGTALMQLGKLLELEMYGSASASNQAYVEKYGAVFIDYKSQDFEKTISELTPPGVDAIGGEHFRRSFNCLRKGGTLVGYGMFNASVGKQSRFSAVMSFAGLLARGWLPNGEHAKIYSIATMKEKHPSWFKEDISALVTMLKEKKIEPVISEVFSLTEARKAHVLLELRGVKGKIVMVTESIGT